VKVASVEWSRKEWKEIRRPEDLWGKTEEYLKKAIQEEVDLIVFPGFTGCFYSQLISSSKNEYLMNLLQRVDAQVYEEKIKELSLQYALVICPGSYWERKGEKIFHVSSLICQGELLLHQQQIYLARWERELGLSRGVEVEVKEIKGKKLGIIVSTDVFYPQVSRRLALKGAEIILSPVGYLGEKNEILQIGGLWEEVQQNQFFAVESGFNGFLGELNFWGESTIYAPLEMTNHQDGYLDRSRGKRSLIMATLDSKKREEAISRFNVLSQLNREFYLKMGIFRQGE